MNLSIIIPSLNEEQCIGRLIDELLTTLHPNDEIIVVDGGSSDRTAEIVVEKGIKCLSAKPSRAIQMNHGAKRSKNEWLYFVHADTIPPKNWRVLFDNLNEKKYEAATFRSKFLKGPFLLRLNAFFTRFNWLIARGGDQSLLIQATTFFELKGYDEEMIIMEEYPLIEHLMNRKKIKVLPFYTSISTRKYEGRSWLKVSRANAKAFKMYKKGCNSHEIRNTYLKILG